MKLAQSIKVLKTQILEYEKKNDLFGAIFDILKQVVSD